MAKLLHLHLRTTALFFRVCIVLLLPMISVAQADMYPGTWEASIEKKNSNKTTIQLKISNGENENLYPAQLQISAGEFTGIYQLLLVRKNRYELGISRNKYALLEKPFSLGSWPVVINNVFRFSKQHTISTLTLDRLFSKQYGVIFPAMESFEEGHRNLVKDIIQVLQTEEIHLKKIDPYPWRHDNNNLILQSSELTYFGITDTVHVKKNLPKIEFIENKKNDDDTISVLLNGREMAFQVDVKRKTPSKEIELQPGLNFLTLFADNYGKNFPNSGKMNFVDENRKLLFDFTKKENIGATFIVARVYYYPGNTDSIAYIKSVDDKQAATSLKRAATPVGDFQTKSQQITLALWDDAVEDGDSISLNINGNLRIKAIQACYNSNDIYYRFHLL